MKHVAFNTNPHYRLSVKNPCVLLAALAVIVGAFAGILGVGVGHGALVLGSRG